MFNFWKKKSKNKLVLNYVIPLLKEVRLHVEESGGILLLVDNPQFPSSNLSNNEIELSLIDWRKDRLNRLQNNPDFLGNGYFKKLTTEYTRQIFSGPTYKQKKSYYINEDFENDYVSVKQGYRQGVKRDYAKNYSSIYVFGSSVVYSFGCEESQTLTSFLETSINNPAIRVLNRGVRGGDIANSSLAILDTQIKHGDLVIIYSFKPITEEEKNTIYKDFNCLDLTNILSRPHNFGDVFFDSESHLTPAGNKAVAELIAKKIQELRSDNNKKTKISYTAKEKKIFKEFSHSRYRSALKKVDRSFPAYIDFLKTKYKPGNNGFAAVNCNPFTLGHQYLLSSASEMVDNLYIFVLEEDKSTFPFKQRFEMVLEGTKNLKNAIVVPTGKFVVSSMTFPDYFSKEEVFNPSMNVSYDFEIFLNFIAPVLTIKKRFIGTEPFCKTTSFQHEIMKKTLPPEGVEVIEIQRKENHTGPISAKKVRDFLENNDYKQLDQFLPRTTIDLLTKYGVHTSHGQS